MAFMLGSLTDGLFAGTKAMSGLMEASADIDETRQRTRAMKLQSDATEESQGLNKAARDKVAAAQAASDTQDAADGSKGQETFPSSGNSTAPGVPSGHAANPDLATSSWQPGQRQALSNPAPGGGHMPASSGAPAQGRPAPETGYPTTPGTPPEAIYTTPQGGGGAAGSATAPTTPRTGPPVYLPGKGGGAAPWSSTPPISGPTQRGMPGKGVLNPNQQTSQALPTSPTSPQMAQQATQPTPATASGLGQGTPGMGQAIAIPTLASSQTGLGPTMAGSMNPMAGQNA